MSHRGQQLRTPQGRTRVRGRPRWLPPRKWRSHREAQRLDIKPPRRSGRNGQLGPSRIAYVDSILRFQLTRGVVDNSSSRARSRCYHGSTCTSTESGRSTRRRTRRRKNPTRLAGRPDLMRSDLPAGLVADLAQVTLQSCAARSTIALGPPSPSQLPPEDAPIGHILPNSNCMNNKHSLVRLRRTTTIRAPMDSTSKMRLGTFLCKC